MALNTTFCSNWDSVQLLMNPEISNFQQPEGLFGFDYCSSYDNPQQDSFINIDEFLQSDDLFYSESDSYTNLLPYLSSPPDNYMISLSPDIFPLQEFESNYLQHYPKRQKSYPNYSYFEPTFFQVPNPEFLPLPEFQVPVTKFDSGSRATTADHQKYAKLKTNGSSVSLSAQSIAARERRRKITEKTQELGKLIPGGHKMNTAEMFHAASKYVKYLQAQVGILQLMGSIQDKEEPLHLQELEVLLLSPTIQEKLYSEEKCLVPERFVQALGNDHDLQTSPLIFEYIDKLMPTKRYHD